MTVLRFALSNEASPIHQRESNRKMNSGANTGSIRQFLLNLMSLPTKGPREGADVAQGLQKGGLVYCGVLVAQAHERHGPITDFRIESLTRVNVRAYFDSRFD